MKISNKTYFFILFIAILSLSFLSLQRFKDFNQSLSEINLPKIEMPETNLDDYLTSKKEGLLEWTSSDGLLEMQYPADWTEVSDILSIVPDQAKADLTKSEILFLAQRIDPETQSLAFLTVAQFDSEKKLEEIIKEIEQDIASQEGKTEIKILETTDYFTSLEMISEKTGEPNFYSKSKIVFTENKTYMIIFSTPQTNWEMFKNEAEEILNSIVF